MKNDEFNKLVITTLNECNDTLVKKNDEYSSATDRLHNFKRAAMMRGCTPIEALAGMKLKHDVSVMDIIDCQDGVTEELLNEKIGDSINYLLLLKAPVIEGMEINPHMQVNHHE